MGQERGPCNTPDTAKHPEAAGITADSGSKSPFDLTYFLSGRRNWAGVLLDPLFFHLEGLSASLQGALPGFHPILGLGRPVLLIQDVIHLGNPEPFCFVLNPGGDLLVPNDPIHTMMGQSFYRTFGRH